MKKLIFLIFILSGLIYSDEVLDFGDQPAYAKGLKGNINFDDIENVNLFNGSLNISIPLGPEYQIGPILKQQVSIIYNSNIWYNSRWTYTCNQDGVCSDVECKASILQDLFHYYGTGWDFNMGILKIIVNWESANNGDQVMKYISPDGSEHTFYKFSSDLAFTYDSSYLKLRRFSSGSIIYYIMDFGNGVKYEFKNYVQRIPNPNYFIKFYTPTKISDPYGNYISIQYLQGTPKILSIVHHYNNGTEAGLDVERVSIEYESFGIATSNNDFDEDNMEPYGDGNSERVSMIKFRKNDGSWVSYNFSYEIKEIVRPNYPEEYGFCKSSDSIQIFDSKISLLLLKSINLPDGTKYVFDYFFSNDFPSEDKEGKIIEVVLPTGGRYKYWYDYKMRIIHQTPPICCQDTSAENFILSIYPLTLKQYFDKNGQLVGYKSFDYFFLSSSSDQYNNSMLTEQYTKVEAYDAINQLISKELYTFSTGVVDAPCCAYPFDPPVDFGDLIRKEILDNNGNVLKRIDYTYEWDTTGLPVNGTNRDKNKRIKSIKEMTIKQEGADIVSYCNEEYAGYGHYKKVYIKEGDCSTGTLFKTIETSWTPNLTNWILNIYNKIKIVSSDNKIESFTKYDFDQSTGYLEAKCMYFSSSNINENANDCYVNQRTSDSDIFTTQNTPEGAIKVVYLDQDTNSQVDVGILDGIPTYEAYMSREINEIWSGNSIGDFRIHHKITYLSTTISKESKYQKYATNKWTDFQWFISKEFYNLNTNLLYKKYDIAGSFYYVYEYDDLFRIKKITPLNEQPIKIDYEIDGNFLKSIKISRPENQEISKIKLDSFGRTEEEVKNIPSDSGVSSIKRKHTYDILGNERFLSSWINSSQEPFAGTIFNYDYLQRIISQALTGYQPTEYYYNGSKEKIIKQWFMSDSGSENYSKKYLKHDALGRLTNVYYKDSFENEIGPAGFYTYDLNDNLTRADIKENISGGVTQRRTFVYDLLGRLKEEHHPEGKHIYYDKYDAMGNVLEKRIPFGNGIYYFTLFYDYAGRLIEERVSTSGYQYGSSCSAYSCFKLRELKYEDGSSSNIQVTGVSGQFIGYFNDGSYAKGKLVMAKEYNIFDGNKTNFLSPSCTITVGSVTHAYIYNDIRGKVTERRLYSEYFVDSASGSYVYFKWGYGYDSMGNISSIEYPSLYNVSNNSNLFLSLGLPKTMYFNYYPNLKDYVKSIGKNSAKNDIIEDVRYEQNTGLPDLITFANGLGSIDYEYDPHNRLYGIEGYLQSSSIFRQKQMQYDSSGNLIYFHNENTLPNPPISPIIYPVLPGKFKNVCFEIWKNYNAYYDGLGHLVRYRRQSAFQQSFQCSVSQGSYIEREWSYDDFGNITSIMTKENGNQLSQMSLNPSKSTNRLESSFINYDYRGNIIKEIKSDNTNYMYYLYSPESQLNIVWEEDNNEIAYQHLFGYDGEGLRVLDGKRWIVPQAPNCNPDQCWCASAKGANWAQETVFIRDEAGNVLAEFDRDIVAGGVQWSFRRYNYYLFGKMVSAEGLLDDTNQDGIYEWGKRYYFHDHLGSIRGIIDGQGHCLQAIEYWPYGEEITSSTYNEDSYRYTGHERDYDINMDYMRARHYKYMIGRFQTPDPVNGSISSPQSWNLYSYVENDPMNYIDPYGLFEVQIEAGRPLNLEYAIKDINAWEMFQHMQILLMFQKNEIEYYLNARAKEIGSITVCTNSGCIENVYLKVPDVKVPGYSISVEGSFADWWSKFKSGYYWGTGYAQYALDYYADIISDPQSTFTERVGSIIGGGFSALWTKETYWQTSLTLSGAYMLRVLGPFPQKGVPKILNKLRKYIRLDKPSTGKGERKWHFHFFGKTFPKNY